MPEAAAALDRDPGARENYVWGTAQARYDGEMLAEAQSAAVQFRTQSDFGLRVLGAVAAHDRLNAGRRGFRVGHGGDVHIAAGTEGYHRYRLA